MVKCWMLAKHHEFEQRATQMKQKGATRCIEKNARGVAQHVVQTDRAVLRWPTRYGERDAAPRKVRYEPLRY